MVTRTWGLGVFGVGSKVWDLLMGSLEVTRCWIPHGMLVPNQNKGGAMRRLKRVTRVNIVIEQFIAKI